MALGPVALGNVTDLVLTSTPEVRAWYTAEGVRSIYLPLASDPAFYAPRETRRYRASFVGSRYGIRERIVQAVWRAGIPLEVFGPGWPNGALRAEDVARVFGESEIVLGVGTVGHTDDVYTLKLRDFDAPMSGAMYVTHRNPDLLQLFEDGREIVTYRTDEECVEAVSWYLAHPDQRAAIAIRGLDRARGEHTWDRRFRGLFRDLGLVAG